jgi:hypothetical protein
MSISGAVHPQEGALPHPRSFRRCLTLWVKLWAALLAVLAGGAASGGGGPENVFLVVNASSADSLAVANAFAALRGIPAINVLMLPWQGSVEAVPIATFRDELLRPILQAIDSRRLAPQIDHVVYSTDFPWRIDFAAELPEALVGKDKFPSGSLTGMTTLFATVQQGSPAYLDPASNLYWRPLDSAGVPTATVGFRSWYGWGPLGELVEAGGSRYLLSTMLGVTAGRGNSVPEIVRYLTASAAADGTKPPGTIYFVTNSDVRTTTRSGTNGTVFAAAVSALGKLGVKSEIVTGKLPIGKRDVAGLMTGSADFDVPGSGSKIVPGAICENLTSFGGIFTPSAGQTPLSAFLRAGAAGSSGTVIEPYAIQAKFPHAAIQVHYARGATLAEAFYQSVRSPYQLLVVGDPLCRPWAAIPIVEAVIAPDAMAIQPGDTLAGAVELEPRGTVPGEKGITVDRFEMFVDGVRFAQCGPGERFTLDTTTMADGHHELRVVAIDSSPVETQGRWIMPVSFRNYSRSLSLAAEPPRVKPDGTVRVTVKGQGLEGIVIFAMGRVLGREAKPEATIEVPAELLGRGMVTIRATGRAGPGATNSVNAVPVTINVTDAP